MIKDLTGKRFGRLIAIECVGKPAPKSHYHWLCQCDCGKQVIVDASNLKRSTRSCGCLAKEKLAEYNKSSKAKQNLIAICARNRVHGLSKHPLHRVWSRMIERCERKGHKSFEHYGARGITVCDEWRKDFRAFFAWAIASGYREGLSIDRINNDGGYSPDNCRWATPYEQTLNRSVSVKIGDDYLAELSKKAVVCYETFYWRIKNGWSLEDALYTPAGGRSK